MKLNSKTEADFRYGKQTSGNQQRRGRRQHVGRIRFNRYKTICIKPDKKQGYHV